MLETFCNIALYQRTQFFYTKIVFSFYEMTKLHFIFEQNFCCKISNSCNREYY